MRFILYTYIFLAVGLLGSCGQKSSASKSGPAANAQKSQPANDSLSRLIDSLPRPTGWVSDFARMLTGEQAGQLSQTIGSFKKTTGNEIVIVTVSTIQSYPLEEYAGKLFNTWGIGEKDKNNGVLILLALQDRKVRIEVGTGITQRLTDSICATIINENIKPHFAKADYYKGLTETLDRIMATLAR